MRALGAAPGWFLSTVPGALFTMLLSAGGSQPPADDPQDYLGNDVCLACHDGLAPLFFETAHKEAECESCHGGGMAHVEAGGDDLSLDFRTRSVGWGADRCLQCHEALLLFSSFNRTGHGRSEVGCADCHRLHPDRQAPHLLKEAQAMDLCARCHASVEASFRKPYGHPVLEGAMQCGDCHNPHTDEFPPLQRSAMATEQGCVSCHADKAGPFVFEHLPLETDDCQTCHVPHGSVNPKMLTRMEIHQLCLECHSGSTGLPGSTPFAFHDIRSPRFRNCTVCHREIHGSNANHVFLR